MSPESYLVRKSAARANHAFYEALQSFDIEAMREVWLDDPTAKCVHPGGELIVGTSRILESWRKIFGHSAGLRLEMLDLDIEVAGGFAWANAVERMHIALDTGTVISEAAATNLFVRREEEWKMVLHHSSPISRRFFAA